MMKQGSNLGRRVCWIDPQTNQPCAGEVVCIPGGQYMPLREVSCNGSRTDGQAATLVRESSGSLRWVHTKLLRQERQSLLSGSSTL